ncbi:MAG: hypothetical protein C0437_07870 [Ralstonia sp.]|nr:hypothetical protein [Ralstonia sp.]
MANGFEVCAACRYRAPPARPAPIPAVLPMPMPVAAAPEPAPAAAPPAPAPARAPSAADAKSSHGLRRTPATRIRFSLSSPPASPLNSPMSPPSRVCARPSPWR